jgi:8-oxo-dGTP diphosphatase
VISVKVTKAACAIMVRDGRVFAARRGHGMDGWEFPGGKVEEGETSEQAVAREIREELGVDLSTTWYLDTIEYDYPDFHLSMDVFVSELAPGEEPRLLEHREGRWLGRAELGDVDWLPADLSLIDRVGAMWDSIFQPSHL